MMMLLKELLHHDVPDDGLTRQILEMEDRQDIVQEEIVTFMSHLLVGNVPHNVVDEAGRHLRMADEYESIGDCIVSVLKANRHLKRHEIQLPEAQQTEILELHDMVADYLETVSEYYKKWGRVDVAAEAIVQGETITKHAKTLYKRLLAQKPEKQIAARSMVACNRQVAAYRRIRDHLVNIAEALAGEK